MTSSKERKRRRAEKDIRKFSNPAPLSLHGNNKAPVTVLLGDFLGFRRERWPYDNFTITNSTGYTIYYLYMTTASDTEWGSDLLGAYTLPDGESFTISLAGSNETIYDLRAVDMEN